RTSRGCVHRSSPGPPRAGTRAEEPTGMYSRRTRRGPMCVPPGFPPLTTALRPRPPRAVAQQPGRCAAGVDERSRDEPGAGKARVAGEPGARRAFVEAVTPRVHVGERALDAEARQLI